ncbi:Ester hydrolase C11orf54-like protein [Cryptotermes secundus]|uniref:Ester hydrolase C11orf54-like protein n=2 Tax=Cryptotermes secundus TaxID=105785 RepID=A0A2J7RE41_9NEOP|nr:ester hydrolase C11orf54 homolog isoform X2 [Cryptotermes secundus]XP_023702212.1 ester hydrolase C11orf54 homolog isoform X2 [Cryptotermes secundus]XP_023702214.1 ester hydrolase C11orf54 homolog isoform X2 [Cryptotermes secundus]XP_023702215.1 ester hydrolase C11orf54 homolog isoform X2 [Cryptotermes secundus]XP_023702216.1 ester hydrolase C11orf54 homolog isoform X2 [Cryptotermes secundus]PNF39100.1 Ester hydrolase C11orf54-like protein [Cryptotermes secundus]PNF39101.1 Ester hydrolase 
MKNMAATVIENPPVASKSLFVPTLEELVKVLGSGLTSNFETVFVEIVDCPDLTKEPFTLACKGLGGKPRLVEIGGPPYLLPLVRREKLYNMSYIGKLTDVEPSFLIGAGAGPWPYAGVNCEMIINLEVNGGKVNNHTRISKVDTKDGSCILERLPDTETRCALLANIFCSEGKPGKVLRISCKKRIGKDDFIASIRKSLQVQYKEKAVGLGGTFLLKEGKAKQHIMPEFSTEPINTDEEVEKWLHFYNMSAPLIAVGTLVSADPGLDLRLQHFHSFGHAEGGHYHIDTEPDNVEYLGYFAVGEYIYRIDQPTDTHHVGRD